MPYQGSVGREGCLLRMEMAAVGLVLTQGMWSHVLEMAAVGLVLTQGMWRMGLGRLYHLRM